MSARSSACVAGAAACGSSISWKSGCARPCCLRIRLSLPGAALSLKYTWLPQTELPVMWLVIAPLSSFRPKIAERCWCECASAAANSS